jgi:hypothetical protein
MTTPEKVAYLKGLAEGLGLGKETKEDKLFNAIIDILSSVASDLEDLEENAMDLGEELDAISDDLALVESLVYDEDDCCCGDYGHDLGDNCCGDHSHEHGDGCCGDHGHEHGGDCCCVGHEHGDCCGGGHDHDDCICADAVFYEITCPACENTITVDGDVLALGKIQCPNCSEMLEFDMENIGFEDNSDATAKENGHGHGCGCH